MPENLILLTPFGILLAVATLLVGLTLLVKGYTAQSGHRGLLVEPGLALTPEVFKSLEDRRSGPWARSPLGEAVYLNTENGRLYAYTDRAGFNNVRQDFWRELDLSAQKEGLFYAGKEFKRNVGYNRPPGDMTPYVRLNARQVEFLRGHLISRRA